MPGCVNHKTGVPMRICDRFIADYAIHRKMSVEWIILEVHVAEQWRKRAGFSKIREKNLSAMSYVRV